MRISLKTIAQELNLSKTTVSWVLQGKGNEKKISQKTQKLVLDFAKKYNYSPNLLAKSLKEGVSNTIGLIIPTIDDTFYSQIAKAVETEAEKFGCVVMFCSSERNKERERKLIRTLKDRRVDGIIIAPTMLNHTCIEVLVNESFPLVVIDRLFETFNTNSVVIDNEVSGYKLTKHLIRKGAKKIAILTADTYLNVIEFRYNGYAKALRKAKMELTENLYKAIDRDNYIEGTKEAMEQIFKEHPDVDGFLFTTHYLAHEGLTYLYNTGKNVNSFHLACFHEMPHFKLLAPRMNIALQPVNLIGSEAVKLLMSDISGESTYKKMFVIPTKIYLRDT